MLQVGDRAPDFELRDQHGRRVALSGLLARSHVLLVFFPAAFSSVCSAELRELRDWWPRAGRDDTQLLAVSCDPMFSLRGYGDAEGIEFPLLSDFWPHGSVCRAYGVFDEDSGTPARASYLVDQERGVVWSTHSGRGQARPVQAYQAALQQLSV